MMAPIDRRQILRGVLAAGPAWTLGACAPDTPPPTDPASGAPDAGEPAAPPRKLRVAALVTVFRHRSHAHVILENFLVPYLFNGAVVDPTAEFEIASLYIDQFHPSPTGVPDMGRDVAERFGIPIHDSIAAALTLGGDGLAVDAVLLIAEHGEYPHNSKGQEIYPKKRFFDEVVAVFEQSGRVVPVYTDKHLSHSWSEAREMVATSRRLGFGLMAGSSVPLSQRIPPLELTPDRVYRTAVAIHGGPMERYGFHGLEILQSMVESRRGGETGIRSVQTFSGDAFWQANAFAVWNPTLVQAALRAEYGDAPLPPLREVALPTAPDEEEALGIVVTYRDGLSAAVLNLGSSGTRWNFACWPITERDPVATRFHGGPWNNRNLFKAFAHAIQHHFRTGLPPYPVERTLLVTGALEAAMESLAAGGKAIETPHLELAYPATDFRPFREMGKTWERITEAMPQPAGIEPVGLP
jgi:hypothetical protein